MLASAECSKSYRFPKTVISYAVYLYHRFLLSYRDVQELLLELCKSAALCREKVRHHSVCFTRVENLYLRFKPLVSTPIHGAPVMIYIEQAIGS